MSAFSPSWVIIERTSGRVIFETFIEKVAKNAATLGPYDVVPIKEHLASLNRREPVQPSSSGGET